MIDAPRSDKYFDNIERTNAWRDGFSPCTVCGRAVNVNKPHWAVYIHCGGDMIVTEAEAAKMNASGGEAADCGGWPIGPDCLKQHPQIKPYAMRNPGIGV